MGSRVLIIEDDRPTVRLIQTALEAKGFSVVSARNGAEGLIAVHEERPDAVILDINLPIMDGFQALRVLRENEQTRSLPVIILSERGADSDLLKGLTTGADLYLTKPFGTQELVVAVARVLPRESDKRPRG